VREALYSTLGDAVEGARVLDLFAGTGANGLEALSRGASFARFVERDGGTRRVLASNVEALGVGDEAEVHGGDALAPRARELPQRLVAEPEAAEADARRWVDLALIDPPYPVWKELEQRRRVLAALADLLARYAAPGAVLVLHTHPRDLAERELRFASSIEARDYNNSRLWYLR